MSSFYNKNNWYDPDDEILSKSIFYVKDEDGNYPKPDSKKENVIKVALAAIGLSLDHIPCGDLPRYDIHNMGAVQVIKLGLLEGVKDGNFYELYLNEKGQPIILNIGGKYTPAFEPDNVYYSVVHGSEKVEYCIILKGLDPMPERIIKDTINIIKYGSGVGVEVYGLGMFKYSTCGGKAYDYHGCLSYADPELHDTTKDELSSVFELEPFESLIGYAFTCRKPYDVEISFSSTTQVPVPFHVSGGIQKYVWGSLDTSIKGQGIDVDITDEFYDALKDRCDSCVQLESNKLKLLYTSFVPILGIDQVITTFCRVSNYRSLESYNDICYPGGGASSSSSNGNSACDYADINEVTRSLSAGQDYFYRIDGRSLYCGIPVRKLRYVYEANNDSNIADSSDYKSYTSSRGIGSIGNIRLFAGSASNVYTPFNGIALVSIDKPSIFMVKKSDKAIGNITDTGALVEDHDFEARSMANGITLAVTPIVTLDRPSNTAYYVDGDVTLIEMEDCIQDNDPTTEELLQETPCEKMSNATSGKVTIDVTLPFLETDESIIYVAGLLGDKFSGEYKNSVSTLPGNSISVSDLGKSFNDGIINKITWSYQDKSFYKASVTAGPFLTGVDSYNSSIWVRHTDQSLSREGVVIGDYGNGLEYKVNVKNIGIYVALNMTMSIIDVGDVVTVSIYNNPAETYYE